MKNKDWIGDTQSVMATLNATSHTDKKRPEHDWYATPPLAVEYLMELEKFNYNIWEPSCGTKHISNVLTKYGYNVRNSDIIDRIGDIEEFDFLNAKEWNGDIVTNPPFSMALSFVEKALDIIPAGNKVAFFLRIQFLEGVKRRKFFNENPPIRIWVSSRNMRCARNGDFKNASGNASTFCWFVWEKEFKGKPELGWFN